MIIYLSDIGYKKIAIMNEPEQYNHMFGDTPSIQDGVYKNFTTINELNASKVGTTVTIRARIHNSRQKGNICFLVLRDAGFTCQAIIIKSNTIPKCFVTFAAKIPKESIIDIEAEVIKPEIGTITGTTQSDIELIPKTLFVISRATQTPVLLADLETSQSLLDEQESAITLVEQEMAPLLLEQKAIQDKHLQGLERVNTSVKVLNTRKAELAAKKTLIEKLETELQREKDNITNLERVIETDLEYVKTMKTLPYKQSVQDKQRLKQLQILLKPLQKKKEDIQSVRTVGLNLRLDNRVIDLRTRANQAIFRIQSGVSMLFREILLEKGFTEIHSPKLIRTASEGGAGVFKVDYFNTHAYLAQSPQLYKQMAVMADFPRVFEIGPVFRAENSNTHRHLTEFTGLDLEMRFQQHYHEVLDVLGDVYLYIFEGLNNRFRAEIEAVRDQFPFEDIKYTRPVKRFTWPEIITLLREYGENIGDFEDISTVQEKLLGTIIKNKYDTDFYLVDKFPLSIRPFYTMMDSENPQYSNSYDFFLRGEEICSGAQRIHDPVLLVDRATHHKVDLEKIQPYIDSFKYGAYPHAGAGAGLERIVMLFLGLGNIRRCSLFPRDPSRLAP